MMEVSLKYNNVLLGKYQQIQNTLVCFEILCEKLQPPV